MPFKNGIDLCNSYHKELSSLAHKKLLKIIIQNQQLNICQMMCQGCKQTVHRKESTNTPKT